MKFKTINNLRVFSDGSICFFDNNYFSKNSLNFFLKTNFQNNNMLKINKNISVRSEGLKLSYRKKILVD